MLVFYMYFHLEQLHFLNCSSSVAQKNLIAVYIEVPRHISTKLLSPRTKAQNTKNNEKIHVSMIQSQVNGNRTTRK